MAQSNLEIIKAQNVIDKDVKNPANDDLGKIKEIMLDKQTGRVAYVVLESGTFLGMGGKLFALPWNVLKYDANNDIYILNVDKEKLKNAPGFPKNHWPDMADRQFGTSVSTFYGTKPYWE